MPGPWEKYGGAAAPASGDPIIAPPDPYKQANEGRAQDDQAMQRTTTGLQNQIAELTIAEKRQKLADDAKATQDASEGDKAARVKLMKLVGKLGQIGIDADDNGGWFETGASGSFARSVLPTGTAGYDLKADVTSLQANLAFDALQAMRDASKTGGALGAISERELDLLQSAAGNINPDQSHAAFLANLESVRQAYLAKLAMIDPQTATRMGYNAEEAENALLSLSDQYNQQFGVSEPSPTIDRSPNPGAMQSYPDDIEAIMQKYGAR